MSSRPLRFLLLFAALLAVIAASVVVFNAERALSAAMVAGEGFEAQGRAVIDELGRLRAAQQAYVAEGQGPDYWMTQASERLAAVDRGLAELATAASNDGARAAVQAAAASMEQFRALDGRARKFVQNQQSLVASDVIFTESLVPLDGAAGHVTAATDVERAAREDATRAARARQFYAAAGAAGLLLLAVMLLAPVPEADVDVLTAMRALTESPTLKPQPGASSSATTARPKAETWVSDEQSGARLLPRPAAEAAPPAPPPEAPAPAPVAETPAPPAKPVPPARPAVDLTAASRVCADLARVLDAGDIPGLLARAAGVLDARGMIVWVADRQGLSLYPMFTHGYPSAVIVRLGSISGESNNATAAAWRSGEVTSVPGGDGQPGALVTPIVTADGCIGVLAAEIADGRESLGDVRAMATIFSAQLATVVTPVDEGSQSALVDRVAT